MSSAQERQGGDVAADPHLCMADIEQLNRLPASWKGLGREAIAQSVMDVLMAMMKPDLIELRLHVAGSSFSRMSVALADRHDPVDVAATVGRWFQEGGELAPATLSLDGELFSAVQVPLGQLASLGHLVVLSSRAEFPAREEMLRLRTAASITSLAIREVRELEEGAASPERPTAAESMLALVESERSLSLILNSIPAMAWSSTADGMLDLCNQKLLDFVGLPPEELLGAGFSVIFHPEDTEKLISTWQQILETKSGKEVEGRIRGADGAYRWFMFRQNPLLDAQGNVVKW